ncbi:hypothetical protein [Streptomyces microflavus]|uniref:hypothetical protein n=1 Tax=Streptomyces microflavus TaxID=1919 RepID=UPI002E364BF2|nr:hypothetical protein [Streptomyces microflavus]
MKAGDRFGRLSVLRETRMPVTAPSMIAAGRKTGPVAAICQCDCGAEATVLLDNLRMGRQISCGCFHVEGATRRLSQVHRAQVTHGLSEHEHFPRWQGMLRRCEDPRSKSYRYYGAKGVSVCPEWHDPAVFIEYLADTLGARPAGHTLDRIDVEGNYEPGNVRWADWSTQNKNKRAGEKVPA